jgi:hypothetical protein
LHYKNNAFADYLTRKTKAEGELRVLYFCGLLHIRAKQAFYAVHLIRIKFTRVYGYFRNRVNLNKTKPIPDKTTHIDKISDSD